MDDIENYYYSFSLKLHCAYCNHTINVNENENENGMFYCFHCKSHSSIECLLTSMRFSKEWKDWLLKQYFKLYKREVNSINNFRIRMKSNDKLFSRKLTNHELYHFCCIEKCPNKACKGLPTLQNTCTSCFEFVSKKHNNRDKEKQSNNLFKKIEGKENSQKQAFRQRIENMFESFIELDFFQKHINNKCPRRRCIYKSLHCINNGIELYKSCFQHDAIFTFYLEKIVRNNNNNNNGDDDDDADAVENLSFEEFLEKRFLSVISILFCQMIVNLKEKFLQMLSLSECRNDESSYNDFLSIHNESNREIFQKYSKQQILLNTQQILRQNKMLLKFLQDINTNKYVKCPTFDKDDTSMLIENIIVCMSSNNRTHDYQEEIPKHLFQSSHKLENIISFSIDKIEKNISSHVEYIEKEKEKEKEKKTIRTGKKRKFQDAMIDYIKQNKKKTMEKQETEKVMRHNCVKIFEESHEIITNNFVSDMRRECKQIDEKALVDMRENMNKVLQEFKNQITHENLLKNPDEDDDMESVNEQIGIRFSEFNEIIQVYEEKIRRVKKILQHLGLKQVKNWGTVKAFFEEWKMQQIGEEEEEEEEKQQQQRKSTTR